MLCAPCCPALTKVPIQGDPEKVFWNLKANKEYKYMKPYEDSTLGKQKMQHIQLLIFEMENQEYNYSSNQALHFQSISNKLAQIQ